MNMTTVERLEALYKRLDNILSRIPDNPIYEEHEARAVECYIRSIKALKDELEKGQIRQMADKSIARASMLDALERLNKKDSEKSEGAANIGKALMKAREQASLSRTELAKKTGLSLNEIAQYETGNSIPKIDVIAKISEAVGVPLSVIL